MTREYTNKLLDMLGGVEINDEEDKDDYPFDFAVRLEDLIDGCVLGGDDPKVLQRHLRNVANTFDDPNSSVSRSVKEMADECNLRNKIEAGFKE